MTTSGTSIDPATGLARVVTRWEVVSIALNDVIGSGVYLLPAAAAALLGPASLWAVALAALVVLLVVLCFAEAATYFDDPGGAYLYTRTAFGDLLGFEVGWMTWIARVTSVASLSAGFAQALGYLWPAAASGLGEKLVIAGSLLFLTGLNFVGVRAGSRAAVVFAASKILPLLLFVAVGAFVFSPAVFREQRAIQEGGLLEAALLLLFAYAGFENTAAPAGEYRRPRRDVPFALLLHIAVVGLLYFGVQAVALGTLPGLGASPTPLADAAQVFLGGWGGLLLTVGAAVSILGTNNNTTLAGPRYLFALAEDGYGPRFLEWVHPRFHTPAAALLVQGGIALPLALTGSFTGLAALSVVARLATYIGTAAAVPVLRRKLGEVEGGFRLPGGPAIPVAACVVGVGLGASAGRENLLTAAVALLAGLVVFWLRRER